VLSKLCVILLFGDYRRLLNNNRAGAIVISYQSTVYSFLWRLAALELPTTVCVANYRSPLRETFMWSLTTTKIKDPLLDFAS